MFEIIKRQKVLTLIILKAKSVIIVIEETNKYVLDHMEEDEQID